MTAKAMEFEKRSKRFIALDRLASTKGLRLYYGWEGYQVTDNKIHGIKKKFRHIAEAETFINNFSLKGAKS